MPHLGPGTCGFGKVYAHKNYCMVCYASIVKESIAQIIDEFFSAYPVRTYQKGAHIILGNEAPEGVFYIISGAVREYDISPHGDEVVINMLKHPAFFPMSWAVGQVDNKYFFQANVATTVRVAPASDVIAFLQREPSVMYDLLQRILRGTDGLLTKLAGSMASSARDRLILELSISAKRFGTQQDDGSILLSITTQELAARTGLARETVSRELSKLRSAGLISSELSSILIPDITQLEQVY